MFIKGLKIVGTVVMIGLFCLLCRPISKTLRDGLEQ